MVKGYLSSTNNTPFSLRFRHTLDKECSFARPTVLLHHCTSLPMTPERYTKPVLASYFWLVTQPFISNDRKEWERLPSKQKGCVSTRLDTHAWFLERLVLPITPKDFPCCKFHFATTNTISNITVKYCFITGTLVRQ